MTWLKLKSSIFDIEMGASLDPEHKMRFALICGLKTLLGRRGGRVGDNLMADPKISARARHDSLLVGRS